MAKSKIAYILIPFVTICALQGALAANVAPTANPAFANYTRPMSFESNRGQTDKQVDFLAHGTGYGLFLSHGEAVMILQRGSAKPGSPVTGTAVRLRPVGANAFTVPAALDEQSSKSNYFIGALIIDPVLEYSTYLGCGSNFDNGKGIAVDAHGNAYVTGHTTSTDFPTKNAFQTPYHSIFKPLSRNSTPLEAWSIPPTSAGVPGPSARVSRWTGMATPM
jgi:Beta-propeller repeat